MTNKSHIKLLPPTFSAWQPEKKHSKQIAVLMSGGVDSSVAAHLLKEDGWDVLGITMKIPVSCDAKKRGCCGADAAFVCGELNIPHYFVDVTEVFADLIIEPFRKSYAQGRTPNPCVDCNTLLKFSLVWDFIEEIFGIKYLATGHYAQVVKDKDKVRLKRADDISKDQSYFLYGVTSERLAGLVLPLGGLTKSHIRSIAEQQNLCVAQKAESMELCFAAEDDYRAALDLEHIHKPGSILDIKGNVIGEHNGIANYTIGQRRGIRFAGGIPLYVSSIDVEQNTITLGAKEHLMCNIVTAKQINILIPEELSEGKKANAKIRSYGSPQPCIVTSAENDMLKVDFAQPQFAPCLGQRLVLYNDENEVIAGGVIQPHDIIRG